MWLEVGETEDSMVDAIYQQPQAGGRNNKGKYGGDSMVEAMYKEQVCGLVVGKTEDSMMDAMCKERGCGWR